MKEKGWQYCSGKISCRQQPGAASESRFRFMYGLHVDHNPDIYKRLKEPHWHRTYETDEGKTIIDWDVLFDTPDFSPNFSSFGWSGPSKRYGNPSISDAEIAEKDYYIVNHLCRTCGRQIGKEEDFYGVNHPNAPHWCIECGKGYVLRQPLYNKEGEIIGSIARQAVIAGLRECGKKRG